MGYAKWIYRELLERGYLNSNPSWNYRDPSNTTYSSKEKHLVA
jgi:hypothetical protein